MKCPFCGKEMQSGILSGDGRSKVTWKAGDRKTGGLARLFGIGKVTAADYSLATFSIRSDYCDDCGKMIFDTYVEEEPLI